MLPPKSTAHTVSPVFALYAVTFWFQFPAMKRAVSSEGAMSRVKSIPGLGYSVIHVYGWGEHNDVSSMCMGGVNIMIMI